MKKSANFYFHESTKSSLNLFVMKGKYNLLHCPLRNIQLLGIVPFVKTPLNGRFVVFLWQLLIVYFWLGQVKLGQVIVPQGQSPPAGARNMGKATGETPFKRHCFLNIQLNNELLHCNLLCLSIHLLFFCQIIMWRSFIYCSIALYNYLSNCCQ